MCLWSVLKKLHFIHGEDSGPAKNQGQKPYGLNQESTLLSISSFLTFDWSGDGSFPTAQPPQVVISCVSMF